ncbi:GFA family protein [Altererythrobacter sp. KTW20L]|uniref:GFA family protein n=1 Tax=Altererythrobacter sp. KTW20L TaxID=2942210 RepID=UPI0020BFF88F|nr:GFA family protein [Altererythrobacter sp. KTW20L]MCL6249903.1 GFA family protein [Altererythrobacter sp. KTW20L]
MATGGCRCGAVRYEISGDALHSALCHCRDCQMAAGAPMVAWLAVKAEGFTLLQGNPASYNGAGRSIRHFCSMCGTPLHFVNEEMLPGIVDIPSVTLDEPDAAAPQAHIQVAERRAWMAGAGNLPEFERWPG